MGDVCQEVSRVEATGFVSMLITRRQAGRMCPSSEGLPEVSYREIGHGRRPSKGTASEAGVGPAFQATSPTATAV